MNFFRDLFLHRRASDALRKKTVGRFAQLVVSVAEAIPRSAARGWRRARDNRTGNKLGIPIGPRPDVALRKTSVDPMGPRNSRRHGRVHQVHSCTVAPTDSAGA